jgi:hypothetical protein
VRVARTENDGHAVNPELAKASALYLQNKMIGPSGVWGVMEQRVWDDYLKWLWDAGLLTGTYFPFTRLRRLITAPLFDGH